MPPRDATGGALLAAIAFAASCAPPLQNGGVELRPGAAERLMMTCRWRHGDVGSQSVCTAPEKPAAALARRITSDADRLGGPLATGRAGDYLLENDEVVFVIDQPGRGAGLAESGGNVVDAADKTRRCDELGRVFASFGDLSHQAIYDTITAGPGDGGAAWVEVAGHDFAEPAITVKTRYTLRPHERALGLSTTVENHEAKSQRAIDLGDTVEWGTTERLGAGGAAPARGEVAAWMGGVGESVAYGLVPLSPSASGAPPRARIEESAGTSSRLAYLEGVRLAPGEQVVYERALAVAPRGDTLGLATELFYLGGGSPGGLELGFVDASGKPVAPPSGARVHLDLAAPAPAAAAPIVFRVGAGEVRASAEAPPGTYLLSLEGAGRRSLAPVPIVVKASVITAATLPLSEAGLLHVRITDLTRPVAPTARAGSPDAGSPATWPAKLSIFDAATSAPVAEAWAASGEIFVPLPEGRYRVVASRGPEFTLAEQMASVIGGGEPASVELALARVVDTRGYVAADLRQRSAASGDTRATWRERIQRDASEGLEIVVASERNAVADASPIVRELGLEKALRVFPGQTIATGASLTPFGEMTAFPMPFDARDVRGGAIPALDRTPRDVLDDVRGLAGEHAVVVVPRDHGAGYFDLAGLDPTSGERTRSGYGGRFDAVEINAGNASDRAQALEDVWTLLRTSHPTTPVASPDFDVESDEGMRTYVAVASDDPTQVEAADLVRGLVVCRDVMLTNGPFATLGAVRDGKAAARSGGVVTLPAKPRDGRLELVVTVERAPWVDTGELVLLLDGHPLPPTELGPSSPTATGALRSELRVSLRRGRASSAKGAAPGTISLAIPEDTFIVAMVRGASGTSAAAGTDGHHAPRALSAPLWIDADGDGRALGRVPMPGCP